MASDDKEKLSQFIVSVRDEINYFLSDNIILINKENYRNLLQSWRETHEGFNSIKTFIHEEWQEIEPVLRKAGLTDSQLKAKLSGYSKLQKKYQKVKKTRNKPFLNLLSFYKNKKSLKSLFSWASIILGSLSNCFSVTRVPIELAKEFLDTCSQSIEDFSSIKYFFK